MIRPTLAVLAVMAATGAAMAEQPGPSPVADAATYIRDALASERPARSGGVIRTRRPGAELSSIGRHYDATIFESRRLKSTRGTGLRLFPRFDR